jgi:hypothetical protein
MPSRRIPPPVVLGVYLCADLVGATLVFLVQAMAARLVLPRFGGSPAVWTTAMLFRASLLAGYGWAHASTTRLGLRRRPIARVSWVILLAVVRLRDPGTLAWLVGRR